MNIDKIEYRTSKKTIKQGKKKITSKVTQVVIFVRKNKVWMTATEAGLVLNSVTPADRKNIKLLEVFDAAGIKAPEAVEAEAIKEIETQEKKELAKKEKREAENMQGHEAYMSDKKTKAEIAAERRWGRLEAEFRGE